VSRDDYEGKAIDPLTLHKNVYAHGNPVSGSDPSGQYDLIELGLIGFGRLALEVASLATRYAPAIGAATTIAGAVWVLSGIALALEQTGFLPTNEYVPYVFAISGALFTGGQSLQALNRSTVQITSPIRKSRGEFINGQEANSRAVAANPGYASTPPYAKNALAAEGKIAADAALVRVYNPAGGSQQQGGWVMSRSEVAGLTLQRYVPLLPARRRESLAALFLA